MFRNRIFTYFAAATPGLRELVTIGKVWELAQLDRRVKKGAKYDLVIVDAPATGHGLARAAHAEDLRRHRARRARSSARPTTINEFITDPDADRRAARSRCPEEMPVNETLDLKRRLRAASWAWSSTGSS